MIFFFFVWLLNWRGSRPGCVIELALTDCIPFFFFSILVRLPMRSTPRGIGRGTRGRRRGKDMSDGSGDGKKTFGLNINVLRSNHVPPPFSSAIHCVI